MTKFVFSVNNHWTEKNIEELIYNNICNFRVNAIRMNRELIADRVNLINRLGHQTKSSTRIFFDTPGSKARMWYGEDEKKYIYANTLFEIDLVNAPCQNKKIQLTGEEVFEGADIGDILHIHRSNYRPMSFEVVEKEGCRLYALAKTDIIVGWGYHTINVDNYKVQQKISSADRQYISFINIIRPEIVGLSFADHPKAIADMRANLSDPNGDAPKIFAKIETRHAVERIQDIIVHADGIIIGRDDLLSWYSQQEIDDLVVDLIGICKKSQIPVIPASNYFLSIGHGKELTSQEERTLSHMLSLQPDYVYVNETNKNSDWLEFYKVITRFA